MEPGTDICPRESSQDPSRAKNCAQENSQEPSPAQETSQDSHRIAGRAHRIFAENLTAFSQDSHRILGSARPPDKSSHREPHRILTGCSAYPQIFSQRASQDSHRKTDLSALQSFQGYQLTTLDSISELGN